MREFIDHLHEVFSELGPVTIRRMFGGYGVYHDGVMFALVADDVLYLKSDAGTADMYESRGLGRFQYNKNGRVVSMSYCEAPEEVFDDREEAAEWARRALDAALRSRAKNGGKHNKRIR